MWCSLRIGPVFAMIGGLRETAFERFSRQGAFDFVCDVSIGRAAWGWHARCLLGVTDDAEMVAQTLDMQMEDASYNLKVPVIYFEDPFDRVDGAVYQGQLFSVMNESFEPVTRPQTAVLNRENNRAYMTFVIYDFVPLEQLLAISAGELDRKVGRVLDFLKRIPPHLDCQRSAPTGGVIPPQMSGQIESFLWGVTVMAPWRRSLPATGRLIPNGSPAVTRTFAQTTGRPI